MNQNRHDLNLAILMSYEDETDHFCVTPFTHQIRNRNHAVLSKFEWGAKNGPNHTRPFSIFCGEKKNTFFVCVV